MNREPHSGESDSQDLLQNHRSAVAYTSTGVEIYDEGLLERYLVELEANGAIPPEDFLAAQGIELPELMRAELLQALQMSE